MARRKARYAGLAAGILMAVAAGLSACGDDDPVRPPGGETSVIVVTNPAEFADALDNSAPGDTIELRAEFSSPTFTMSRGFTIPASRSPVTIMGTPKAGFLRPEIIFPTNVTGITLDGHSGSVIQDLDITGGLDVIALIDSEATIQGLNIRNNVRDGVTASGSGSSGLITRCLFDHPGQFGVSTHAGATVTMERNTVIGAGDCGLYIDSNATARSNLCYDSHVYGIVCFNSSATIECNDCFLSGTANYSCPGLPDPSAENNLEVDPRFCPGGYRLSEVSPLINAGACGQIGALTAEPECLPASE